MAAPTWNSTAIFLAWDDWGGFYDHEPPPDVDGNGYGLRVPGLVISPYAKQGYIDSQILSFDAYLKFIEDDFLNSQRLDPATDGRPDPRTSVREDAPQLGDLVNDFDFSQTPRLPLFLDPYAVTPGSAGGHADQAPATDISAISAADPSVVKILHPGSSGLGGSVVLEVVGGPTNSLVSVNTLPGDDICSAGPGCKALLTAPDNPNSRWGDVLEPFGASREVTSGTRGVPVTQAATFQDSGASRCQLPAVDRIWPEPPGADLQGLTAAEVDRATDRNHGRSTPDDEFVSDSMSQTTMITEAVAWTDRSVPPARGSAFDGVVSRYPDPRRQRIT
jgi:hypothetical protein